MINELYTPCRRARRHRVVSGFLWHAGSVVSNISTFVRWFGSVKKCVCVGSIVKQNGRSSSRLSAPLTSGMERDQKVLINASSGLSPRELMKRDAFGYTVTRWSGTGAR
ncbi:hypothetical protein GWI33_010257 [Rhynchophorus ferrugineus]|uniref:Uncharacterized protein n=1 Tax=Rhynchophorus ferrugineus TaxID=354439 RepID=A0A834I8I1_RHYFE|nr:hypothetical protein GWI33_010257 [Rhynchophorus ferrugineus]